MLREGLHRKLLLLGVLMSTTTALAAVAPGAAVGATYACNPCAAANGPNQTIDEVSGRDYEYNIVYVYAWKFNGGSNYNLENWTYSETTYHVRLCLGANHFSGHGETTAGGLTTYLWGNEANAGNCALEF